MRTKKQEKLYRATVWLFGLALALDIGTATRAVDLPPNAPSVVAPAHSVATPATTRVLDVSPAPAKLEPKPFTWRRLPFGLPQSIKVYEGEAVNSDGQPIHAWYVDVDYSDRSLEIKSVLSKSASGRETTSALAQQVGALVAVNGAYFGMTEVPASTYNTVISDGQVLAKNPWSVKRGGRDVFNTRGVFGVRRDRTFEISWVAHIGETTFGYPSPLPNTPENPSPPPSENFPMGGKEWNYIREAMGGGPVLVKNNSIKITDTEELFGGSHTTARHPRTAVGFSARGHLILFAIDGRQPHHSVGMTLPELAQTMRELGCIEALNFDGGGSTAIAVNGKILNRPSDGKERPVTSVLAIVPSPDLRVLQPNEQRR
jgi:hypothetical protein